MYYLSVDPHLADYSIILPCPYLFMYIINFKIGSEPIVNPCILSTKIDIGIIGFQQFIGGMERRILVKIQIPLIQPDYIQALLSDPPPPIIQFCLNDPSFALESAQSSLIKMSHIIGSDPKFQRKFARLRRQLQT